MPKDRDQLTPDDPEDAGKLRHPRSADRAATGRAEETGPAGGDPEAVDEVAADEKGKYR